MIDDRQPGQAQMWIELMNHSIQGVDVDLLRRLTDPTGGYTQLASSTADLPSTVISIADDLGAQYTIGFESEHSDGRFHTLKVTTRNPSRSQKKLNESNDHNCGTEFEYSRVIREFKTEPAHLWRAPCPFSPSSAPQRRGG